MDYDGLCQILMYYECLRLGAPSPKPRLGVPKPRLEDTTHRFGDPRPRLGNRLGSGGKVRNLDKATNDKVPYTYINTHTYISFPEP